jgi:hypothetical protein
MLQEHIEKSQDMDVYTTDSSDEDSEIDDIVVQEFGSDDSEDDEVTEIIPDTVITRSGRTAGTWRHFKKH